MTQLKIGEFTGLSSVHVCRTMRRFERAGVISYPTHGEIVLDDLDALCQSAGVDLDVLRREIVVRRTP